MTTFKRIKAETNLETLIELHDGHGTVLGYEVLYPDGRLVTYDDHINNARSVAAVDQAILNLKFRTNERDEAYAALDRFGEKIDAHEALLQQHINQLTKVQSWMDGFKRQVPTAFAIGCSILSASVVFTHLVR